MAVGQKKLNVEDQAVLRAMASMGGGIASSGCVCGALTGAVVFLGSILGKDEPDKKDDPLMWKVCNKLYQRFENEVVGTYGSVNCRDISGVSLKNRRQVIGFNRGDGRAKCAKITGKSARILGEVLEDYSDKLNTCG